MDRLPRAGATPALPAAEQARQQVEPITDMALVLAHRIRGLVTSIEGYTDLLIDTLATRDQRDLALRIFESAAGIERVLADLNRFAQPVHPVQETLTVSRLVDDLFNILEDDHLGVLLLDVNHHAQLLEADPVLTCQALVILIQNAREATPGDTIGLRVRIEGTWAIFEVHNKGMIGGVGDPEKVFKPFYTTKAQNLGVGLPIARRIAQAQGGDLTLAKHHPVEGTCFALHLPVKRLRESAQA